MWPWNLQSDWTRAGSLQPRSERTIMPKGKEGWSSLYHSDDKHNWKSVNKTPIQAAKSTSVATASISQNHARHPHNKIKSHLSTVKSGLRHKMPLHRLSPSLRRSCLEKATPFESTNLGRKCQKLVDTATSDLAEMGDKLPHHYSTAMPPLPPPCSASGDPMLIICLRGNNKMLLFYFHVRN